MTRAKRPAADSMGRLCISALSLVGYVPATAFLSSKIVSKPTREDAREDAREGAREGAQMDMRILEEVGVSTEMGIAERSNNFDYETINRLKLSKQLTVWHAEGIVNGWVCAHVDSSGLFHIERMGTDTIPWKLYCTCVQFSFAIHSNMVINHTNGMIVMKRLKSFQDGMDAFRMIASVYQHANQMIESHVRVRALNCMVYHEEAICMKRLRDVVQQQSELFSHVTHVNDIPKTRSLHFRVSIDGHEEGAAVQWFQGGNCLITRVLSLQAAEKVYFDKYHFAHLYRFMHGLKRFVWRTNTSVKSNKMHVIC